ncbi:hypothetical protein [Leuconostoc suionicum]|uniref:hypothetical protein n=1 Tax=Leuconostoc suionicum TaxID=1511761 RepID=UPI001B8C8911|nr:hypothetical protein [Leuconostoc suionicum]MBS1008419.1 hypothetical protein [Leuconostoc suionicum]
MFLIGIFGIIVLIYMAVRGLWNLIPWLIFAGFGYYSEKKELKEKVNEKDQNTQLSEQLLEEVVQKVTK